MSDADFIRRAIDLAIGNIRLHRGGPFGAVIVHDGVVLAEGTNLVTHSHDPTAHAEIVAIREACRRQQSFELKGCTIYSSCEPCPMCLGAIYWARLDRLVFASTREDAAAAGFDDSFIYDQLPLPIHARSLPTANILRDEGARAFQAWLQFPQRIAY